jgi:hypothetical protein
VGHHYRVRPEHQDKVFQVEQERKIPAVVTTLAVAAVVQVRLG